MSKNKKPLVETKEVDLTLEYNLTDLKKLCRHYELPVSGTKKKLLEQLLAKTTEETLKTIYELYSYLESFTGDKLRQIYGYLTKSQTSLKKTKLIQKIALIPNVTSNKISAWIITIKDKQYGLLCGKKECPIEMIYSNEERMQCPNCKSEEDIFCEVNKFYEDKDSTIKLSKIEDKYKWLQEMKIDDVSSLKKQEKKLNLEEIEKKLVDTESKYNDLITLMNYFKNQVEESNNSLTYLSTLYKERMNKQEVKDESKQKRKVSEALKKMVAGMQHYRCQNRPNARLRYLEHYKCPLWSKKGDTKGIFDSSGYEIDHIIEHSLSGNDSVENLQALCKSCHSVKTKMFLMNKNKENK